jgi:hypothetical protein
MDVQRQERRESDDRNRAFFVSAATTILAGLFLGGMALWMLRPEVKIVKEVAPSPKPIIIEKFIDRVVEVEKPKPRPVPQPGPQRIEPEPERVERKMVSVEPSDGVWRAVGKTLPMFQIWQRGSEAWGTYSPANWQGVFHFKNGRITGDTIEFAVADPLCRVHFRMKIMPNGREARVEGWITPDDAVLMLDHASRMVKNPQQAVIYRAFVQRELARLGKPTSMGVFRRIANPSEVARGGF